MLYKLKKFGCEDDFWRIRTFLRECFLSSNKRKKSWLPAELDYWRWHVNRNCFEREIDDLIWFWESDAGEIMAVMHPAGRRDAVIDIHPNYKTVKFEAEIIETALQYLSKKNDKGENILYIWSHRDDKLRNEILQSKGFERQDINTRERYYVLSNIPQIKIPKGFILRSQGSGDDVVSRSWASWTAFHPDEPDEKYEGWEWFKNLQNAPLYRRDLDVVMESPEGKVVGFATVWFDDYLRTALFEPVGIDKDFHRQGLGRALMLEGLRRSAEIGATLAIVVSEEEPAHQFYQSVGFTDYDICDAWLKSW
ncbi:MAG: GNAT family N-acetyltransferase [Candidatus Cloacimonetes bacterium]|nr:GNAT family N-acetyltransferase [Candidatus Cloacimonadota bacterium]